MSNGGLMRNKPRLGCKLAHHPQNDDGDGSPDHRPDRRVGLLFVGSNTTDNFIELTGNPSLVSSLDLAKIMICATPRGACLRNLLRKQLRSEGHCGAFGKRHNDIVNRSCRSISRPRSGA